jgi:hypothetical protein
MCASNWATMIPWCSILKRLWERFAQLRDLGAHPALGKLGELFGVSDAGQQRFEHRPGGL